MRLSEELAAESPANDDLRHLLAGTLLNLGAYQANQGRADEARESMLRADELSRELVRRAPETVEFRGLRGKLFVNLGNLFAEEDAPEEALARFDEAIALLEPATAAYPGRVEWRAGLQEARLGRAERLVQTGRYAEAVQAVAEGSWELADPDGLEGLEVLAAALGAVRDDAALSAEDRSAVSEAYVEEAIRHASDALDSGLEDPSLLRDGRRFGELIEEPAFLSFLELVEG